jgi:hypothetical protein
MKPWGLPGSGTVARFCVPDWPKLFKSAMYLFKVRCDHFKKRFDGLTSKQMTFLDLVGVVHMSN